MAVIELRGIAKSFKHQTLFTGVDLDAHAASITGIVGHNGSGKSVLFKIMCGFVRPDAGTVSIDPAYVRPGERYPRDFGIIIDRPGYLAGRTGMENLRELAAIRGKVGDAQILAVAKELGIAGDLHRKVRHYSLGMKQKLALTQAVMEDQKVLLLDEPFNALDADSVAVVRARLLREREAGKTIIFTSHQREDMDLPADTVYRVNGMTLQPQPDTTTA